jgi:hypothetical protein
MRRPGRVCQKEAIAQVRPCRWSTGQSAGSSRSMDSMLKVFTTTAISASGMPG